MTTRSAVAADLRGREHLDMQMIRAALGAIAMAEPAVFWLYFGEDRNWHMRQEGDPVTHCYLDRPQALQALRLAAIRCQAYSLFLQDEDGRFRRECFNWLPADR